MVMGMMLQNDIAIEACFMENVYPSTCPSCGADWPAAGQTCQEAFHQMLYWENDDPRNGQVHHLAVLCYHLQHPELYSPEGLNYALGLLVDFLEHGQTPQQLRRSARAQVASGKRDWKITGRPGAVGGYAHPVRWSMTCRDVVAGGIENYVASVNRWAAAVLADLRVSGYLSR